MIVYTLMTIFVMHGECFLCKISVLVLFEMFLCTETRSKNNTSEPLVRLSLRIWPPLFRQLYHNISTKKDAIT